MHLVALGSGDSYDWEVERGYRWASRVVARVAFGDRQPWLCLLLGIWSLAVS